MSVKTYESHLCAKAKMNKNTLHVYSIVCLCIVIILASYECSIQNGSNGGRPVFLSRIQTSTSCHYYYYYSYILLCECHSIVSMTHILYSHLDILIYLPPNAQHPPFLSMPNGDEWEDKVWLHASKINTKSCDCRQKRQQKRLNSRKTMTSLLNHFVVIIIVMLLLFIPLSPRHAIYA